jgi:hypothetical protein
LEIALDRVCDAHGLKSDAVRSWADTKKELEIQRTSPPDLDYLRDLMADMESFFTPTRESKAAH